MSLATKNHMEQQVMDEAVRCAKHFASEVLETLDDTETIGALLDTMEFFHSIGNSSQFIVILQILHEALDMPMPHLLPYYHDELLLDVFFSHFMSEMIFEVINGLGGDDIIP